MTGGRHRMAVAAPDSVIQPLYGMVAYPGQRI